ncbi:hypothetical protein Q31b_49860 [Novipirellula aureliae]|uniref:Uncharacterized protein n=1 Tax=Novipirellula aureliae TaxID=2527966 RepID=A0A5C6DKT0_9BACT|nr:hypothetical protein [Novipirellula aureliae]TWU36704.1 hypothetical protein Q31b_49860 [Novipirellula aureliae]
MEGSAHTTITELGMAAVMPFLVQQENKFARTRDSVIGCFGL